MPLSDPTHLKIRSPNSKSATAAHAFGPVLLAGAEVVILRQGKSAAANLRDGSLQFAPSPSRS
jgi:hypothetical protein